MPLIVNLTQKREEEGATVLPWSKEELQLLDQEPDKRKREALKVEFENIRLNLAPNALMLGPIAFLFVLGALALWHRLFS